MGFEALLGNEQLKETLSAARRKGRMSHFYLLSGPRGSGKHTLADLIAAAMLCREPEGPCGVCAHCRKVLGRGHPDYITIDDPTKKTVPVDLIRQARADIFIRPNEGERKIYLVPRAQDMGIPGQNALLKVLEEPPPYVLFLLLCDGAENLLETIRSRAPALRLEPIPDREIRDYLRARRCTLSEEDLNAMILRADGCIGQALTLADARAVKPILKMRETCDEFMGVMAARRCDSLPAVLSRFGNKRDAVMELLGLITLATRDLILLRHGDTVKLKYYVDRDGAEELACRFTTKSLLNLYGALERAAASLEGNGNIRLTLMGMAVELSG